VATVFVPTVKLFEIVTNNSHNLHNVYKNGSIFISSCRISRENCCQRWKQNISWVHYCSQNTIGDKSVHFSISYCWLFKSWTQFWMKIGVHKCMSSLCMCQQSPPMEPCTYISVLCTGPMSINCWMSQVPLGLGTVVDNHSISV